jgi:hypothetical protein
MVVQLWLVVVVIAAWLMLGTGACGGPSCIRNTDCPHGQRCLASSCQDPGAGAAAASGTSGVSGSTGNTAGVSGSISDAGTGGQAGAVAADAGVGGAGP